MCGIHGIVSQRMYPKTIRRYLSRMGDIQRHRGPDDQKEIVYSHRSTKLGFGFVRLSIIDLDTGMQPISSKEDGSSIICNGQIYNYIELRQGLQNETFVSKGDIEVALHLYRKLGLDFLQLLNGMYAGAIFDPKSDRLLLFRDRFGIKPLYYCEHDGDFIFASEIKPLLEITGKPKLDESLLPTLLTYRYLPGDRTLFKGIRKLPPGSYLDFDLSSGKYEIVRYWEYRLDCEKTFNDSNQAIERFNELFEDSVRLRLRSDVEVGSLLSGGIDSSAVASAAAMLQPSIQLFTMAFSERKYNELELVRQFIAAKRDRFAKASHNWMLCGREMLEELPGIIHSIEEPISLGAVLPTDSVCRLASESVKVVLTGEGADEIFAGYRKYLLEVAAQTYPALPPSDARDLVKRYPELPGYLRIRHEDPVKRYIQSEALFDSCELSRLLGINTEEVPPPAGALPYLSGKENALDSALAMESRFRLPDYVILRLDKLSMRHSLETRTPFLDYRLAEFAASLPTELKVNLAAESEKHICRLGFERSGMLDSATAYRPKQPFTIPLADWLSEAASLPDFMQEILLGDIVRKQGIFDAEMFSEMAARVSGKGIGPETLVSEADRVWAICVFSLWYETFFAS